MGFTHYFLRGKGSLCQWDVYGAGWNPAKATEGADGNAHRDTFNHFSAALADWDLKIPVDDKIANVIPV